MTETHPNDTFTHRDLPGDSGFFDRIGKRFDLLLHREILRLRVRYQLSLDEFRGLYISDDQVDAVLRQAWENNQESTSVESGEVGDIRQHIPDIETLTDRADRLAQDIRAGMPRRWQHLQRRCRLSDLELELIQLAMLMEFDNKYETLFGYLNNDVSRKYPTVDMALRLFDQPRERVLVVLMPCGKLFSTHLFTMDNAQGTSVNSGFMSQGFRVDAVVMAYLLGLPFRDPELNGVLVESGDADVSEPLGEGSEEFIANLRAFGKDCRQPVVVLEGRAGTGRGQLAASACAVLEMSCVSIRLDQLPLDTAGAAMMFQRLQIQLRLLGGGIAFQLDRVDGQAAPLHELQRLLDSEEWRRIPCFLLVSPGSEWQALLGGRAYLHRVVVEPDVQARRSLWRQACARYQLHPGEDLLGEICGQFLLTPQQIDQAAGSLALLAPDRNIDRGMLYRVARQHSIHDLDKLAQKVVNRHAWDDLVLPAYTERGVREFIAAIRNRHRVYSDWNMGWRSGNSQGLIALFSGSSGTGKTVTAGVIANEIGLDLYRVDLSAVVSKYIGDTEKNLDRIFNAAQRANVILFLDECDSLMGKRSEVKDAHDRYANLEVSYLLQKIELHQGVVITATNFAKNIDQAFSRRMHYVIEFARPNEAERERLWRCMFPQDAPLADDINFSFLASQFELPGGDIRTVALDAAFLAAEKGQIINMQHLVNATARQLIKQGKAPRKTEFKQYQELLQQV